MRKVAHTISLASQRTMSKLGQLLAQRVDVYSSPDDIRVPQNGHCRGLQLWEALTRPSGMTVSGNQAGLIDHALEFEAMEANDMADAKVIAHVARSSGVSCRTGSSTSERPEKHQKKKTSL